MLGLLIGWSVGVTDWLKCRVTDWLNCWGYWLADVLGLLIGWSVGVTDWLKCWGYWLAEMLGLLIGWSAGWLAGWDILLWQVGGCDCTVFHCVLWQVGGCDCTLLHCLCCRAMKAMTRRRWSHIFSSALVLMNWNPPRGREHSKFHGGGGGVQLWKLIGNRTFVTRVLQADILVHAWCNYSSEFAGWPDIQTVFEQDSKT